MFQLLLKVIYYLELGEIRVGEILLVNAGSTTVGPTVKEISGDYNEIITFILSFPILLWK